MSYPDPSMGGPPMDQMDQGAPPMGPPGMAPPMAPNLLPFASTQPAGIAPLLAPLLQQQQMDQDALKKQQLEAVMALVMQQMQEMPNPAAEAAQVEPSQPLDGMPSDPGSDLAGGGGGGDPMADQMAGGY